jgi:hypothetical protein
MQIKTTTVKKEVDPRKSLTAPTISSSLSKTQPTQVVSTKPLPTKPIEKVVVPMVKSREPVKFTGTTLPVTSVNTIKSTVPGAVQKSTTVPVTPVKSSAPVPQPVQKSTTIPPPVTSGKTPIKSTLPVPVTVQKSTTVPVPTQKSTIPVEPLKTPIIPVPVTLQRSPISQPVSSPKPLPIEKNNEIIEGDIDLNQSIVTGHWHCLMNEKESKIHFHAKNKDGVPVFIKSKRVQLIITLMDDDEIVLKCTDSTFTKSTIQFSLIPNLKPDWYQMDIYCDEILIAQNTNVLIASRDRIFKESEKLGKKIELMNAKQNDSGAMGLERNMSTQLSKLQIKKHAYDVMLK